MSADDLELARQFLEALRRAATTGDREAIYPLLAFDVAWLTPMRDLHGIEEVRGDLTWIGPPENLDVEYLASEPTDLGGGRIAADVREVFKVKQTGAVAHARDRRIEVTIRDRRIAQYEMSVVG